MNTIMKKLLITTAFFTTPMIGTVVAQSDSSIMKRQIAEQNRQIVALEQQVDSLQDQLNLERSRKSEASLTQSSSNKSTLSANSYTVIQGDTFSGIAKKNRIKLADLISANRGVSPNKISIGQKLNLPTSGNSVNTKIPVKVIPRAVRVDTLSTNGTHVVSKGDTFYSIALVNNISMSALQAVNPGVKPTKVQIGQRLNLTKSATTTKKAPVRSTVTKTQPTRTTKPAYQPLPAIKSQPVVTPIYNPVPIKNVAPAKVARAVAVSSVMTYGEFARRNRTTTSVLNALNGLDLPSDESMAVGSELFVPNKY